MKNKELGNLGEKFAAELLEQKGYIILHRQYSCKFGEIDLIAKKHRTLYFVEVKTRQSLEFGYPSQGVSFTKKRHMENSAMYYLSRTKVVYSDYQFKIVEIYFNEIDEVQI